MADITKVGVPSLSSVVPPQNCQLSGLLAGEALPAGSACYLKSDGKIWLCDGSAADALAKFRGMNMQAAAVGDAVTLYHDVNVRYGSGMTPGAPIYVSVNAGLIADATSTGGDKPIGYVVDATRIHIWEYRD